MSLQRNAKCYEEKSYHFQVYHCLKVKPSFREKLFQKEKNNCYGFVRSDFQVICGFIVGKIAGCQAQPKPLPIHIHCLGYIFYHYTMLQKFCWFRRFLFYDFYFGFYSLNASNIYYSTKHLCIHYDLLLQQHSYLNPLLFYAHYCHLLKTNTSLALIQHILR